MVDMEIMNSDGGSSIRRRSLSLSSHGSHHTDNDVDCESVSEAGDIGDRALPSRRFSESNSFHSENGSTVITKSSVRPLPQELSSTPHLSTDATVLTRYLLQKLFDPGVACDERKCLSCVIVAGIHVNTVAVTEIVLHVQRYVAGGFAVETINANLHATEVPALLVL